MAKPDIEKIEFDKYRVVGERPVGELFANEETDLFWKHSYVVGFDDHTNIGALVNADHEQDAIDAAADFYEDIAPGYFIDPKELDYYDEDALTFVGNHGLPVLSHLIWVVKIPNGEVPPAVGAATDEQMRGLKHGAPGDGAGDVRYHAPQSYVLYRDDFPDGALYYVSHFPGEGGKDWGYDKNPQKAKRASPYWVKRFRVDMQRVGKRAGVRETTFGDTGGPDSRTDKTCIRTSSGKTVCGTPVHEGFGASTRPVAVRLLTYEFGRDEKRYSEEAIFGPTLFDAILTAVLKGYRSDRNFHVVEAGNGPYALYWNGRVSDRNIVDDREELERLILDRLKKMGTPHKFAART